MVLMVASRDVHGYGGVLVNFSFILSTTLNIKNGGKAKERLFVSYHNIHTSCAASVSLTLPQAKTEHSRAGANNIYYQRSQHHVRQQRIHIGESLISGAATGESRRPSRLQVDGD
jgi:hypothetical protein